MLLNPAIKLDPAQHAWLRDKGLTAIFAAFSGAGAEARAVGGAVRNALMNLPVADVDLAVNVPPEQAETILQKAKIKTVRTGFVHGTITAVVDHRGYEITSLRRDVATDGRHAEVAYTDAWAEDAGRRDFTMNALYVDAQGQIYDFYHGLEDLRARHVRFIGEADARIEEDYLRILRFFRFYAAYGQGAADKLALAACAADAPQMAQLSRERITQEWRKLLLADNPLPALDLMREHEILPEILPLDLNLQRLAALLNIKEATADYPLRQAALLRPDHQLEPVLRAALRLSQAEMQAVMQLCDPDNAVPADQAALPRALYRHGAEYCRKRLLLQHAEKPVGNLSALLAAMQNWQAPVFPLQGGDLLALGLQPSPQFGDLLRAVEEWWIAGGFKADKTACIAEAKRLMNG